MEKLKIIFMGTPDFSVPVLQALAENYQVAAVYTQPPKPVGRGGKLTKSPVQVKAEELEIPVLTPKSFKKPEVQEQMRSFQADIGIVAAYGLILPPSVLDMFPKGCVNVHASLLPRWRGAAPIQRALMAGDAQTGVTIMKMDAGLDTGPMLLKESVPISEQTTGQQLHDILSQTGVRLLLRALEENPLPVKQPDEGETYAKKIERDEYFFDFSEPADVLERKIRALGSLSFMRGEERISVLRARVVPLENLAEKDIKTGTVLDDKMTFLCGQKTALVPLVVKRSGKRAMPIEDFLRGCRILKGERF